MCERKLSNKVSGNSKSKQNFSGFPSLFAGVPPQAIEKWADNLTERHYAKGQSLYWQGDSASNFYLIQSGTVKVVKRDPEGREFIVGFFGPGEFVGCCCLIGNGRLPCSASAVETTVVWRIPQDKLFQLMTEFPQVAIALMRRVTGRLRQSHTSLQSLALDTAEKRVVLTLLDIGQRFGIHENGRLLLPPRFTRLEDLANMVGCTLETISRTITRLRETGWLERRRRQLVLLNPDALHHEIEE